jgi:hypothetical protein
VIAALEAIQLGGTTQWIRIPGRNTADPVLLVVQQGPGLPMLNEVRRLEHLVGLEQDFRPSTGISAAVAGVVQTCARFDSGRHYRASERPSAPRLC